MPNNQEEHVPPYSAASFLFTASVSLTKGLINENKSLLEATSVERLLVEKGRITR